MTPKPGKRSGEISPKSVLGEISEQLVTASRIVPSEWAERYRVLPSGAWTFDRYPWLKHLHDLYDHRKKESIRLITMKAAQMGFTETGINLSSYTLDIPKLDVLYVFPTTDDVSDFSSGRFELALELAPHMQDMFTDTDNVFHKRAGIVNLYCRGSRSKSKLKSVPVSVLVLDEVDEMIQANVELARERLSGQDWFFEYDVSTPSIPDFGIDYLLKEASLHEWMIPCPHCSKSILLEWETSVDKERKFYFCPRCKVTISHEQKLLANTDGHWQQTRKGLIPESIGFHISQIYSPTQTAPMLIGMWERARSNEETEQVFFNSKLGETHVTKGSRLTDETLDACTGTYAMKDSSRETTCMGIDVGLGCHYEIARFSTNPTGEAVKQILAVGTVLTFHDLGNLIRAFSVGSFVVDLEPERRESRRLVSAFPGMGFVCTYPRGDTKYSLDEEHSHLKVNRTETLSDMFAMYRTVRVRLPYDTPLEFRSHLKALIRITKLDSQGNPTAKYLEGNQPDHFAHASNYCNLAYLLLPKEVEISEPEPVIEGNFWV